MQHTFEPSKNQAQQWYWFDKGFSKEELQRIEDMVSILPYQRAATGPDNVENTEIRKSNIKWIPQTPEWGWLYRKLMRMAKEANDALWHFDITHLPEAIQYTEYEATELGKYDWHQDIGDDNTSIRKISMTIQLSESDDYEGGDLCIWRGGESLEKGLVHCPRGAGNVVIFPSYMYHAVKPVTKGTRKSFVLWLGGGHYK